MGIVSRARAGKSLAPVFACLAALAVAASGCTEPVTVYQVPGSGAYAASGKKILIMPFMDTRTFVDNNDPHKLDMGAHARNIFASALREHSAGAGVEILTPDMRAPSKSLTNAEVAEIGRRHGADAVVSGQVFSFNQTRAASIPPRAGMFVRVVSSADGALLFVGDHYQAASVPGASGGRDLQARLVADQLVEGLLVKATVAVAMAEQIASATALAVIGPLPVRRTANKSAGGAPAGGNDRPPPPSPLPGLSGPSIFSMTEWDDQFAPEPPPALDFDDDSFYSMPMVAMPEDDTIANGETEAADIVAAVLEQNEPDESDEPDESADISAAEPEKAVEVESLAGAEEGMVDPVPVAVISMAATEIDELPELELGAVDTAPEQSELANIAEAGSLSGDDLASDLFESEADLWTRTPRPGASPAAPSAEEQIGATGDFFAAPEALPASELAMAGNFGPFDLDPDTLQLRTADITSDSPVSETAAQQLVASGRRDNGVTPSARRRAQIAAEIDDGPIYSTPLVSEQPRTYKAVDNELAADPAAALQSEDAKVEVPSLAASPGARRILILPYHDRPNPNNLIPNTGGGEVVTTLFGTQLALDPNIQLLWDATGEATHDRLLSLEDAIEMGRLAGADFVVRGQVVEFRRAQSVPSLYSAVISTAVLAAQVVFAEMSGVDVATEVYRVSDGLCVMSRRDRAQQKYVVQAEKTVRRMAAGMAESVVPAILSGDPEEMDPLIDQVQPVTIRSNPR